MSVNTPLRELILINVGRVNYIMQTIAEDLGALAAENERLRGQNASLEAEALRDAADQVWHRQHAESVRQMLNNRADQIEEEATNDYP